ncbi:MAG TPA: hypothetical protein VN736_12495 [Candidatus Limnocylindrales bacterium]|nr:hypothetical protein [Candidatus Limnocylindrales bacterium]
MPSSETKIAANRANAKKSTGPKSTAGKVRSSRNAIKHGFRSDVHTVFSTEDVEDVERIKADLVAVYEPQTGEEFLAIEHLAIAHQRRLRASRFETSAFTKATVIGANDLAGITPLTGCEPEFEGTEDPRKMAMGQSRNVTFGHGVQLLCERSAKGCSNVVTLALRYSPQVSRDYRFVVEEVERIFARRNLAAPDTPNLPNEPKLPR